MKLKSMVIIFCIVFLFLFLFCYTNNAFAIDYNIVNQFTSKFKEQSSSWHAVFHGIAIEFFKLMITFQCVYFGYQIMFAKTEIYDAKIQFVKAVFTACFFLLVILNFKEWSTNIIQGLNNLAGTVLNNSKFNAEEPFITAVHIYDKIEAIIEDADLIASIMMRICSVIIMICFALITARVIMIKCEIYINLLLCLIIVPLGACDLLRDKAITVLHYIVGVGMKLLTISLICGLSFVIFDNFEFNEKGQLKDCIILIGTSIIILALVMSAPEEMARLISNVVGTSGSSLMQAWSSVSNTLTTAATSIIALNSVVKNGFKGMGKALGQAFSSHQLAKENYMEKGANGKYIPTQEWKDMSNWQKTKETAAAWNSSRKTANANRSTIYQEAVNAKNQLRQLKERI